MTVPCATKSSLSPNRKSNEPLSNLGGDDLLHAILDRLQSRQGADLGDVRHRVGDDRGRGIHQLRHLRLHGLVGLRERLERRVGLLRGLVDRVAHRRHDEIHACQQHEQENETEPIVFHARIINQKACPNDTISL